MIKPNMINPKQAQTIQCNVFSIHTHLYTWKTHAADWRKSFAQSIHKTHILYSLSSPYCFAKELVRFRFPFLSLFFLHAFSLSVLFGIIITQTFYVTHKYCADRKTTVKYMRCDVVHCRIQAGQKVSLLPEYMYHTIHWLHTTSQQNYAAL